MKLRMTIRCFTVILAFGLMVQHLAAANIRPVQKGDKITIRRSALFRTDNGVEVCLNPNLKEHPVEFIRTSAKYSVNGEDGSVVLFIQRGMTNDFLGDCEAAQDPAAGGPVGSRCSIIVSSDFQYGAGEEKNSRFLVYWDKSVKTDQTNFVNAMGEAPNEGADAKIGNLLNTADSLVAAPAKPDATTVSIETTTSMATNGAKGVSTVVSRTVSTSVSTNSPAPADSSLNFFGSKDTTEVKSGVSTAHKVFGFVHSMHLLGGGPEYLKDF